MRAVGTRCAQVAQSRPIARYEWRPQGLATSRLRRARLKVPNNCAR